MVTYAGNLTSSGAGYVPDNRSKHTKAPTTDQLEIVANGLRVDAEELGAQRVRRSVNGKDFQSESKDFSSLLLCYLQPTYFINEILSWEISLSFDIYTIIFTENFVSVRIIDETIESYDYKICFQVHNI